MNRKKLIGAGLLILGLCLLGVALWHQSAKSNLLDPIPVRARAVSPELAEPVLQAVEEPASEPIVAAADSVVATMEEPVPEAAVTVDEPVVVMVEEPVAEPVVVVDEPVIETVEEPVAEAAITVAESDFAAVEKPRFPSPNRISLSARFGLNISGSFGNSGVAIPPSAFTTPNSDTYNYDDGYVLPDVSGSGDGYTWYWGYNDSNSQLDTGANQILLHQSAGTTLASSSGLDDGISPGFELAYTHELGTTEDFRYGFEAALNYINVGMSGSGSYALRAPRDTFAFNYTAGTMPPSASPGNEYQGTYDGPGFVIDANGTLVDSSVGTVGTVTGRRNYDGNLWGGRLGPYIEQNIGEDVLMSFSGGLALGVLNSSASWNETFMFDNGSSIVDSGSGDDSSLLWGGYVAANLYWRLSERWAAVGSVQFQSLGTYDESFGTRRVELDLSKSFFLNVGVSYNF